MDNVFPVTADIDGKRVTVGEAKIVMNPTTDNADENVYAKAIVTLNLDTPEGRSISSMINQGQTPGMSVSSHGVSLFKEQNKEEKTDD